MANLMKESHWHHNNEADRTCYYDYHHGTNIDFCSCPGTAKAGEGCAHPATWDGFELKKTDCKKVY